MDPNFGGVAWTKHAISRMRVRGIKQGDAWATWRNPDSSKYAKVKSAWVYWRQFGDYRIEVVAKKGNDAKWVILSVWDKKPVHKT